MLCSVAVLMQSCGQNKNTKSIAVNWHGTEIDGSYYNDPYYIWTNEVRDTSFALPRKLLDKPEAFMRALTEVQMINRVWTDTYNYTEKLLFGDSILGKICKEVADGKCKPVFLIDNICDEENFIYYLEVKKGGDLSYASYRLAEDGVMESTWKMSEFYSELLDEWNKEEMFLIGETDEEKRVVTHTGRIICIGDVIGRNSGCITRMRCDGDSVYVDMVKLYLWTLKVIMDEAEEIKRKEQILLLKQARQQGEIE